MTREFQSDLRRVLDEDGSELEDACGASKEISGGEPENLQLPDSAAQRNLDNATDLGKKLEEKQREVDNHKDALLRALADLENYKRRAQKERAEIRSVTIAEIMETLLPVLDNFEFGLAACQQQENKVIADGFRMILMDFQNLLSSYGLEEICPLNEKFDANFHDCVRHVPDNDRENDTVISVDRKGYKLSNRLLRPAAVTVSYRAEQEKEDSEKHE
ncbi:MAG: nucleotide exchange factor GrpE [Puniceicoccales bacterium]|nr:nucleotide exchange factor GrpE [Puniceicoccales bacterium]